jgi:aspartate racemase
MGYSYPVIVIYSLNFQEFIGLVESGNRTAVVALLCRALDSLSLAGADFALMASNTPHMFFDEVSARSPVPLVSIVEETGKAAKRLGFTRVGLFGTKFTMQADFYSNILSAKYGVSVVVPRGKEQDYIHRKIMTELINDRFVEETRQELSGIAGALADKEGIEALILGCTELPLILSEESIGMPILDTTRIHAEVALDLALSES